VARRLKDGQLHLLAGDPDWRVRYEVAGRIALKQLARMLADEDPMVRELASARLASRTGGQSEPGLALV
jgi:HEAT repeat protein